MKVLYDPPSGWRYGFPKEMPAYSSTNEETNLAVMRKMLEDAKYPKKDIEMALTYGRFILIEEE